MLPTQDALTISRRSLDVEDYIDIVRRHKGWIVGPMFAAVVVSVVVAFMWPDSYLSESIVQVVPPQVPERYVPSNINSEMSQRINQMAQTVQSRANLVTIIQGNNLYRGELQRQPMEDVLEGMR
ncbi:MAG: Wzz/FepE/Etk N-terminal domain-containing protein, partial [Bryobacteraceae bacterium]